VAGVSPAVKPGILPGGESALIPVLAPLQAGRRTPATTFCFCIIDREFSSIILRQLLQSDIQLK